MARLLLVLGHFVSNYSLYTLKYIHICVKVYKVGSIFVFILSVFFYYICARVTEDVLNFAAISSDFWLTTDDLRTWGAPTFLPYNLRLTQARISDHRGTHSLVRALFAHLSHAHQRKRLSPPHIHTSNPDTRHPSEKLPPTTPSKKPEKPVLTHAHSLIAHTHTLARTHPHTNTPKDRFPNPLSPRSQ